MAAPQRRTLQDLRAHWPLLAVVAAAQMLGPIGLQAYSFGVFVKPLRMEFSWSLQEINIAFSCVLLGVMLGGPFAGFTVDRVGPRLTALLAIPATAFFTALLATTTRALVPFYVFYFFTGFCTAFSYNAFGKMLSLTFTINRGAALGIMAAGVGVGALIGPILLQPIVDKHGWALGYLVMAGALLAVTPFLWASFRQERVAAATLTAIGAPTGQTVSQAIGTALFWLLFLAFALYGLAAGGVLPNLMSFLTENGLTRGSAARYVGLAGIATAAGRLIAGLLYDRLRGAVLLAVLTAAEALAFIALAVYRLDFLLPAVVIYGFSHGGETAGVPYLIGRYFGVRSFGAILGIAGVAAYGGIALGPIIFGALRDHTGTFAVPMAFVASMAASASILFAVISRISSSKPKHPI